MRYSKLIPLCATLLVGAISTCTWGQEPATDTTRSGKTSTAETVNAAAIAGSKQDPAAVSRGEKTFAKNCAGCHGATGKGGPGAPNLIRSLLVLDDEKGILIAPVIREGRPDKGMPKLNLSEPEISDIVAWLHVRTYAAGHRNTYTFGDVVTGDAKKGEAYFNSSAAKCSSCHSVSGDLAGIGRKYDSFALQGRWLHPGSSRRGGRGGNAAKPSTASLPTVTVTPGDGKSVSGTLDHIDDFTVSLREASGEFHSFSRNGDTPKIEVHDPLKAHTDLLRVYTDADIHNVTAYLVTLK
jgi:cytochrome c oxidase cbb3-type subunit III